MSPPQESELIVRAADGDGVALGRLVDEHEAAVFRYALSLLHNRADAEEVLQETFLAFTRNACGFRGESSLRTWLLTIARNAAWRLRKRTAARAEEPAELDALGRAAGWGSDDPETLAIRAERERSLEAALAALPDEEREIVVLRDLEGLPGAQTAAVLGLSVSAMKSRLHRARLRLAAELRAIDGNKGGAV